MNSNIATALDEVIRQFGRQLIERPEKLRAALTDVIVTDDNASRALLDAVIAVSETGVATQIATTGNTPITPESVYAWLAQLTATGVSPGDAAIATNTWALVIAPTDATGVISAITQSLTAPDHDQTYIASMPRGDETVMGDAPSYPQRGSMGPPGGPGPSNQTPPPEMKKSRAWLWILLGALGLVGIGLLVWQVFFTTANLQTLYRRCESGSAWSCDDLYKNAADGGNYQNFGATCGGRTDGVLYCADPDVDMSAPANSFVSVEDKLTRFIVDTSPFDSGVVDHSNGGVLWDTSTYPELTFDTAESIEIVNRWYTVAPAKCTALQLLIPPAAGGSTTADRTIFERNDDDIVISTVIYSATAYADEQAAEATLERLAADSSCSRVEFTREWNDKVTHAGTLATNESPSQWRIDWVRGRGDDDPSVIFTRNCDRTDNIISCVSTVHQEDILEETLTFIHNLYEEQLADAREFPSGTAN